MNSTALSILIAAIFLLLGIPIGFLVNLKTPAVQSFLEKGALSVKGKKLEALMEDYWRIKTLSNTHAVTSVLFARLYSVLICIFGFLLNLTGAITFVVILLIAERITLPTAAAVSGALVGIFSGGMLGSVIMGFRFTTMLGRDAYSLVHVDEYEVQVAAQLRKLGMNPDEYLKSMK